MPPGINSDYFAPQPIKEVLTIYFSFILAELAPMKERLDKYKFFQRLVLLSDEFDKAVCYLLRVMIFNFMNNYGDYKLNEMPIRDMPVVGKCFCRE